MSISNNKTNFNYIFGGKLDVYGKLTSSKLDVLGNVVVASVKSTDNNYVVQFAGNNCPYNVYVGTDNTNNFLLANESNNGTLSERLRITAGGLVGIGTDNPERTLDVVGSIRKTVYEPGEIIETLEGICDGNDVTVKSGTYTLANVNADQVLDTDSHATISGSSIEYTPPAGTTRVCYEFWVYMRDSGSDNNSRPLLHFQSKLDNASGTSTTINNSRHTWRSASGINVDDTQVWIYNKVFVSIGQVSTESVANGRLVSWNSARTFRWTTRRFNSSYAATLHETQHWDGSGTNLRVRPHVKITAIA